MTAGFGDAAPERFFDLRVWDEPPRGGRFAAWEVPEDFVAGLRQAVELWH